MRVGIIGAGPGGIALGILLARAGFHDFTIFDREDGVGGTWRINTYPGLACDVKSHLYSYSFDLNPHWSRLWSGQREILEYFERCAEQVRPAATPAARAPKSVPARWDDARAPWQLTTGDRRAAHEFDVVVSAVGLFTQPVLPDLVEEEPFTGTVMHSSRWDHSVDLTGQAGGRPRYRIDGVPADTGVGEGRRQGVLGAALADLDPAQAGPALHRNGSVGSSSHVPFAKKLYRTRLWLRSESNISVIEHGSEKTQEFTAIAPATAGEVGSRRAVAPHADSGPSDGLQAAGLFVGLSRGVDPAAMSRC